MTVSFSVAQAVTTGEAIERGLKRREAEGRIPPQMGPVVTLMVGRLDDWIKEVAARDKMFLDPGHLEWCGVAAFKRAYQEFRKRGLRARMLSAAFRNVMHWSEFVGGDVVVSPAVHVGQAHQRLGLHDGRAHGHPGARGHHEDAALDPRVRPAPTSPTA